MSMNLRKVVRHPGVSGDGKVHVAPHEVQRDVRGYSYATALCGERIKPPTWIDLKRVDCAACRTELEKLKMAAIPIPAPKPCAAVQLAKGRDHIRIVKEDA